MKGFTLIELLAVILILGIIALIAIPQVTNVIENASKGAAETSAEHYLNAATNKIGINKLDGDSSNDIKNGIVDIDSIQVDISGEGPTSGILYIQNGTIKGAELVVNGYEITCDEKNKCEAYKGIYRYYARVGKPTSINDTSIERPTNTEVYIKYKVENSNLSTPSSCIYINNKETCLNINNYEMSYEKTINYVEYDPKIWTLTGKVDGIEFWNKTSTGNFPYCYMYKDNPYNDGELEGTVNGISCTTKTDKIITLGIAKYSFGVEAVIVGKQNTDLSDPLMCYVEPSGEAYCVNEVE